jgi:Ca2+-binding RTX toxin-like protein
MTNPAVNAAGWQGVYLWNAMPGVNFVDLQSVTLNFADGEASKTVSYQVLSDSARTSPVVIGAQLTNPSSGIISTAFAYNTVQDSNGGVDTTHQAANVTYSASTDGSVYWNLGSSGNVLAITGDSLGAASDRVVFAGGGGSDMVDYSALSAAVTMTGVTSTLFGPGTWATVTGTTVGQHRLSAFTSYVLTNQADSIDLSGAVAATNLVGSTFTNSFVVNAGGGDDTIKGSIANDNLTGGTGSDTFVFSMINSSSATAGNGNDTIADFSTNKNAVLDANEDKIDLSAIFSGQGITVNSGNLSTYLNVVSGANSQLQIDRDGAGTAYTFTTIATLTAVNMANADLNNLLTSGQLVL